MKRAGLLVLLLLSVRLCLPAQEPVAQPEHRVTADHSTAEGESDSETLWKWANFVILAAALGWLIAKTAPGFFQSRTEQIQRGITEATRLRQDAENRAAKMEIRMASLESEIDHIRSEARSEMAKEAVRLRKETEQALGRIQAHGTQEVSSLVKHAEKDLRVYAAQLAIQLAEQRIRGRMAENVQEALVDKFLRQMNQRAEGREAHQ